MFACFVCSDAGRSRQGGKGEVAGGKLDVQRSSNEFQLKTQKCCFSYQNHMLPYAIKADQPCCHSCIHQTVETYEFFRN